MMKWFVLLLLLLVGCASPAEKCETTYVDSGVVGLTFQNNEGNAVFTEAGVSVPKIEPHTQYLFPYETTVIVCENRTVPAGDCENELYSFMVRSNGLE